MRARDVQAQLQEMYGVEVSATLISSVTSQGAFILYESSDKSEHTGLFGCCWLLS
jgi:transposase-like protein